MNIYEVLSATTAQYRKGPAHTKQVTNGMEVQEFNAMPHESEIAEGKDIVDVHFIKVAVDRAKAEEHRPDVINFLKTEYPDADRLRQGPSYIEVGASIGDQGAALCLFALGQSLGLWSVITPATLGITDGSLAQEMAGMGYVMIGPKQPLREALQ